MVTNDKKTKRNMKIIFIIILLILITLLARFAWARYLSYIEGKATADIATWSFKVNDKTNDNFIVNLGDTRKDIAQQAEVQKGYVGPGTAGKFQIKIDGTDSDVSIAYDINMNVEKGDNNKFPKNLIFYSDSEMKNAIYADGNVINLNGFIDYKDTEKVKTHDIYWLWDYQTGQTPEEINANDVADSFWIGKDTSLSINVIGRQVTENPSESQCTVTFDANGGIIEGYGNSEKITKNANFNSTYGELPIPKRDGYKFDGWVGKNLFSGFVKGIGINHDNGQEEQISTRATSDYIEVDFEKNEFYICSGLTRNIWSYVAAYNENKEFIGRTGGEAYNSITIDNNSFTMMNTGIGGKIKYIRITQYENKVHAPGTIDEIDNVNIQFEAGNSETTYEPYNIIQPTTIVKNVNHTLTAKWIKQ